MVTKIAHLSDLHFGRYFDFDTWNTVKDEVVAFAPHLLVVSGDLVDHPSPLHLLAAKGELQELATSIGAELVVVPGNHDLYAFGTRILRRRGNMRRRSDWYDRIFGSADTVAAAQALADRMGEPPRFTETYRKQPALTHGFRRWFNRWVLWRGDFTDHLPRPPAQTNRADLVTLPDGTSVLLALLDSNARNRKIGTATGSVSPRELLALRDALRRMNRPYVARIAVIHHHVLPIAFVGGDYIGAEPLMVLHNAGTVLSILAELRFDLVLHGHRHQPQFARVDFDPETADGYPLAVAAAGSAALKSEENPRGNSYNLVTIGESGQIEVTTLVYGGEAGPTASGEKGRRVRTFPEAVSAVKRRAFIRARERHGLECDRWHRKFEVTEHGDLKASHEIARLRLARSNPKYRKRPHDLFHSPQGRLVEAELFLDSKSVRDRYGLALDAIADDGARRCWVSLPHSPCDGETVSYTLHHGYANALKMTQWEALERWRFVHGDKPPQGDWDTEWVGTRITHPVQELAISLTLPDGLRSVKPYVECRRHHRFPDYPIDEDSRDALMPLESWKDPDLKLRDEENQRLSYDPLRHTWHLAVLQPMVGYNYQLRWKLPGDQIDPVIQGQVVAWQRQLLAITGPAQHPAARQAFEEHRLAIEILLQSGANDEHRGFELFVYERSTLALVPVFSHRSWTEGPLPGGFRIALGDGIAGTAFQQRRTVPWSDLARHSPFIEPEPYPEFNGEQAMDMKTMIAIPVYHPVTADNKPSPPPWSAIGVVCFSSSSEASNVAGMCTPTPDAESEKRMAAVRALAQSLVHNVLKRLAAP